MMKSLPRMHTVTRRSLQVAFVMLSAAVMTTGRAAPGTIATSPLFLEAAVQPNIFFVLDDSGSMDWEVLLSNAALQAHPWSPNSGNLDFTPNNSDERRELCYAYNVMAYNPNRSYTAWQGEDIYGNTFADASWPYGYWDPYYENNWWNLDDLSNHFYLIWNDADGDGEYDNGECPTASITTVSDCRAAGTSVCQAVADLSASERTNYANWYSYYRKREYVAKRALSQVISESTSRMGFTTINEVHNRLSHGISFSLSTPVRDVDDITTPVDPTAASNKATLLDNIFQISSAGFTPLRQGLAFAGHYYEDSYSGIWSTPILSAADGGECQQNFTVLVSDGFWNGSMSGYGNTDTDGAGPWDGGSYADSWSDTLADVAMYYYENDLAPSLADNVKTIPGIDDNSAQHMVTFTVAFGVNGTLSSNPPDTTSAFAWPEPISNTLTTVDDMRHAAWNGRGIFLNASNPSSLISSFSAAISSINSRTGTAAAVTFNSTSLQSVDKLYQAGFNSKRWSGELTAYNISTSGITGIAWKATSWLDATAISSRNIVTWNGSNGAPFDWSSLTSSQKDDLRTNASGGTDNDATAMARLGYIKGDRACEQNASGTCYYSDGTNTFTSKSFRQRDSRLGDIVHSSPVYVGAPATPYPEDIETASYASFASANKNRAGVTYVGANDGMLHAFNDSGEEIFAYVPGLVYSTASGKGLHALTETGYNHNYYVDLSPTVADVYISGAWKTVLLGGLRGGGKGVFAIDVTDPSALQSTPTSQIMWEFTNDDLGYTFSDIRVGKMNNGKWAAIFGNGYNTDPNGDGSAKLFIVYIDGSNLSSPVILDTNTGSMVNNDCGDVSSDCNGLSTPALADLNGDGRIDRIYAGDLHGNLWAFDVSDTTASNWGLAYGTDPLFKACTSGTCTTGNRQPITSKPSLARHLTEHNPSTAPNLMIFFGTGQYLTSSDNSSTQQQTFYGVFDSGSSNLDRGDLQPQTITETGDKRTISDTNVDYSTQNGWYIDLPTSKERVVVPSITFGRLVFFNSMIPSTSVCSAGGYGWLMAVDQLNGGEPSFIPIDVNGDGVFDTSDMLGSDMVVGTKSSGIPTESRFISNKRVTADSTGNVGNMDFTDVQPSGPQSGHRTAWTGYTY